ncbi:hypothetical protein AAH678_22560 [Sodalis endosymbiont of Spalangia cameroni]
MHIYEFLCNEIAAGDSFRCPWWVKSPQLATRLQMACFSMRCRNPDVHQLSLLGDAFMLFS